MTLISDFFEEDHRRLDTIFNSFQQSKGDAARHLFAEFKHGLLRHIDWEERLLFPTIEDAAGLPSNAGPTRVMRMEHEQIQQCLTLIEQKMENLAERDLIERRLLDVLAEHNIKEERILYPMCDNMISAEIVNSIIDECRLESNPSVSLQTNQSA